MANKFKRIKTLINQRFDALETELNAIKINQRNINRRLDSIEEKLENTNRNPNNPEKHLND